MVDTFLPHLAKACVQAHKICSPSSAVSVVRRSAVPLHWHRGILVGFILKDKQVVTGSCEVKIVGWVRHHSSWLGWSANSYAA
jgi:hypothetical protein